MLAYSAGDGLQAIARTYGIASSACEPKPTLLTGPRTLLSARLQALSRLFG